MRNKRYLLLPLLLWLLAGCQPPPEETAISGHMHIYVSESHQFLINREADVFQSLYPQAHVTIHAATSRECFVHLINDSVRFVLTDRAMNDEERRIAKEAGMELEEVSIAIDALGLFVNRLNEIDNLSLKTLQQIAEQKITRWEQVPGCRWSGPLMLVTTGRNSGAYELLKNQFLKMQPDLAPAVVVEKQAEVLAHVAKNPQALGLASLACFKDTTLNDLTQGAEAPVRSLAFMVPDSTGELVRRTLHQYYVYQRTYPLTYPVVVTFNTKSKLAIGFSAFIASGPGQKIVTKIGLGPATMPVRYVQFKKE